MSLELYSTILTLGSIGLCVSLIIFLALYFLSPKLKSHTLTHKNSYTHLLHFILLVTTFSVITSLVYQLVYETPVCELCWWQRIFFYPVPIITAIALWYKTKESHMTTGILAVFGLFYASYHYYYHFQGFVLGNKLTLPCSVGGLLPACTNSPILVFGFATIPFMGVMMFMSIIIICIFSELLKEN
jgi:disulfide bond formation protein DsbB